MMEEKQMMTNKQVEAEIRSLRCKSALAKVLASCSTVVAFLFFCFGAIPIGVIIVVIASVCEYLISKYKRRIKSLLSDDVVSGVLKEVLGDSVEYNPWGKINPGSMVFPFSYNCADGSDHIKAVYHGLNIELGDIELIRESQYTDEDGQTQQTSYTQFKGQWLICDFGKELAGEVYISEREPKTRRMLKSNVTMDNEAFDKRFCVRADNPQEAYYILTPHMMEYISTMADKSGGTVYLSFLRNGKMHVAVKTGRDFFELGKSNADVEGLRQKFLGELRWFTDLIDTLRVEDTLYKKESNI